MVVKSFAHILSSLSLFFIFLSHVVGLERRTKNWTLCLVVFVGVPSLPTLRLQCMGLLDFIQSNSDGEEALAQENRVFMTFEMEFRQG